MPKAIKIILLSILYPAFCTGQFAEITEIKAIFNESLMEPTKFPWIEIKNSAADSIELSDYSIVINGAIEVVLPNFFMPPGQYFTVWFADHSELVSNGYLVNLPLDTLTGTIELKSFGTSYQSIHVPLNLRTNESYGRYPESSDNWIYFPENFISPGERNPFPGPWQKIADSTSFSPRDSSPNAALYFNGRIWVLAGWRYISQTNSYDSNSDVHTSEDGITWTLVNDSPPYNPYGAFISHDGWMWAIAETTYRSKDGITWEDMGESSLTSGGRVTSLNGELYWIRNDQIWKSTDAIFWTLITDNPPWQLRDWPGLVTFQNKLWFFGGGINYPTDSSYYFNDVWSSANGKDWILEADQAEWPGRYWFTATAFDGKLWIMNGWNYFNNNNEIYGNQNDVWYSEDGRHWNQLIVPTWNERHATLSWHDGENFYISSGYGGGGQLFNDIWRYEKQDFSYLIELQNLPQNAIYGDPPLTLHSNSGGEPQIHIVSADHSVATTLNDQLVIQNAGTTSISFSIEEDVVTKGYQKILPFTVQQKQLTVAAPEIEVNFGTDVNFFDLSYSGFVYDDTVEDLDSIPFILNEVSFLSPEGEYDLELTGGAARNYFFHYQHGKLKIKASRKLAYFPNPANSFITFASTDSENLLNTITIYSRGGKKIGNYEVYDQNVTIDTSGFPAGVHTVVITTNKQITPATLKIVIER